MNAPEVGKLYRARADSYLYKDCKVVMLLNGKIGYNLTSFFESDRIEHLVKMGEIVLVTEATLHKFAAQGKTDFNWIVKVVFGELIGYVTTKNWLWDKDFQLMKEEES